MANEKLIQKPDDRIVEMFIDLPEPSMPPRGVKYVRQAGNLLVVGQALPLSEGRIVNAGRLGLEVSLDQGKNAARVALLQLLGMLRAEFGTLNKIKQCVELQAAVACGPDFQEHSQIAENASSILLDVFGPNGLHTLNAFGVISLPRKACVSLSMTFIG